MPENNQNIQQDKLIPDLEKQKLLKASEVSLWLDTYDDIFSDFDPRPYSERALSDDFIHEARKAIKESKTGKLELKLLIPAVQRNASYEHLIKKRLKEHFVNKHADLALDRKKVVMQGAIFIAVSIIVMTVTTFILMGGIADNFYARLFAVISEPAGWFLFWEGLNLLIFDSKQHRHYLKFSKRMVDSNITFISY